MGIISISKSIYGRLVSLAINYKLGDESTEQAAKRLLLDTFREELNNRNRQDYEQLRNQLRRDVTDHLERLPDVQALLVKVRYWLEDELILICPQSDAYIGELQQRFNKQINPAFVLRDFRNMDGDTPLPPRSDLPLYFDIEFKSEYLALSQKYLADHDVDERAPISLVAQSMFVVAHQSGIFYTLHDRSFAGADDQLSKYAMITGRVAAKDIDFPIPPAGAPIKSLWRCTMFRELQELDELGLSIDMAERFTNGLWVNSGSNVERTKYIGIYKAKDGKVLSILFAIYVTVDEYNQQLTQRGPYLIPVMPQEFSKFRTLHLLNDILHHNSCSGCLLGAGNGNQACHFPDNPCIIRDINGQIKSQMLAHFDVLTSDVYRDTNIGQYHTRLGEDSAILAVDIPDYSLLDRTTTANLRNNLEQLIDSYFSPNTNYRFPLRATPTGYLQILQIPPDSSPVYLALIAYFLAIYLSVKLTKIAEIQQIPDVRLALHMDSLQQVGTGERAYFPGNGVNRTLDIISVGQPRQILGSLSFVMHLLSEFEGCGIAFEIRPNANLLYRKDHTAALFTQKEFKVQLQKLGLPASVSVDLLGDSSVNTCYESYGLPVSDFGFFVQANGLRYRVFNLGIFNKPTLQLPDYGNRAQPTARIPIIARNTSTTVNELDRLVKGLKNAEHLMMYGYSNVRMMREIYKIYVRDQTLPISLQSFRIVFCDFDQFREVNETRDIRVTKANWVRGFLYAHYIAQMLIENNATTETRIAVNRTRYGFNVLKVIYSAAAEHDCKDHIRFTVPMPGRAFELSPVFIINRGDPLYHGFLEISERYVEKGIKENSAVLNVTEYAPHDSGYGLLQEVFNAPTSINGTGLERYDKLVKQMKTDPQSVHAVGQMELGDYYVDLLQEEDFAEACRLYKCIGLLEDDEYRGSDGGFDIQRFLSHFRV